MIPDYKVGTSYAESTHDSQNGSVWDTPGPARQAFWQQMQAAEQRLAPEFGRTEAISVTQAELDRIRALQSMRIGAELIMSGAEIMRRLREFANSVTTEDPELEGYMQELINGQRAYHKAVIPATQTGYMRRFFGPSPY